MFVQQLEEDKENNTSCRILLSLLLVVPSILGSS